MKPKTSPVILAGDIGATKTVLALLREVRGKIESIREEVYNSQEFSQFEEILARFLAKGKPVRIKAACLGVAGPVRDGRCKTTNLSWSLDEQSLAKSLGVKNVCLLNDLAAMAYGMLFVSSNQMAVLNEGHPPQKKGNIAVIAAGTGLGEALLCWNGQDFFPVASEGGHVDFAPQTDVEIELFRFLRSEYGHVSYERILSGPGILNIYKFLQETGFALEPDWLRKRLLSSDPSSTITEIGLQQGHKLCTETLALFTSIYGAEAGNLALKTLSLEGVYLGGGIAPKILDKLKDGTFMRAFSNKGRYSDLLKKIPVKVALDKRAGLIGAAHYILRLWKD
jgi:glucokinase